MDLEEAMCIGPGDKLIFTPQDGNEIITPSALVPGAFETLYFDQPLIVSSVISYKELNNSTVKKPNLSLLERLYYRSDEFKNKKDIDLIHFEIEESISSFPMQLFSFPEYRDQIKYSHLTDLASQQSFLIDVITSVQDGDFEVCDYLDALVDTNIYDISLEDYSVLMYLGESLVRPLSIGEVSQQKENTIAIIERELERGTVNQDDLEDAEDIDVEKNYRLQFEAAAILKNYYLKTAQFCDAVLKLDKDVITYSNLVSCLTTQGIKPNIMNVLFDEGFIVKKEFLGYAAVGYQHILDNFSNKD